MSALAEIRRRIESTGALIAKYEGAIADDPKSAPSSLSVNIRALEKLLKRLDAEFQAEAQSLGFEVYKYRLLNEDDAPALMGVGEAWAKFQKLFGAIYTAMQKANKTALSVIPQLGYGYTFAGSIGVVVTVPREARNLIGQSALDEASETLFDLVESRGLQAAATRLGPEPIEALNEWLAVHTRNHFGMALQWRSEDRIRREIEINYRDIAKLQDAIYNAETKSIAHLPGELIGVHHKQRTFSFKPDNGKEINGTYDEDAISWEHAASVPARYRASIITKTKIIVLGKDPKTTYTLSALADL